MHISLGILGSSTDLLSLVCLVPFSSIYHQGRKGATREDLDFLRVASCPLWFVDLPPRAQRCNERRSGSPSCSFVPFVVCRFTTKDTNVHETRSGALLRATERSFRLRSSTFSAPAEAEVSKFDKRSCGGSCDERQNPSRILVPE